MHFIREAKTNTAPADVPMRLGGSTWSRGLISAIPKLEQIQAELSSECVRKQEGSLIFPVRQG